MSSAEKIAKTVFSKDPKAPSSISLSISEEMSIKEIFEMLLMIFTEGMKILFEKSELPLYADESCVMESDVQKCAGHFHGINIKLTKCSGPTPALRMIETARGLGLKVMMGSMNESSIGSAAIAHFLQQLDHVDMDGPLLLSQDIATGITFNNGIVTITDKPGLGITLL